MTVGCAITAISWERINLTITAVVTAPISSADVVEFMLVDVDRELPIRTTRFEDGIFRLDINVTNFEYRRQVPNGTWRFIPYINGEPGPAAGYDLSRMSSLDAQSRSFLYAGNTGSYLVNFGITEDEDPDLVMRAYKMSRGNPSATKPNVRARIRKRVMPQSRRVRLANRWYRLARRLNPPRGNRILFASEMRLSMEGNLLRVHERMIERGLDVDRKFRYSFRVPHTGTKLGTLRLIYLLATSDVVLIDDYFGVLGSLQVSPETKIIQVWHAGSGFKSIGFSRFGNYGSPKLQNAHRKVSYAICGSQHLVPVYAEAFGIEESAVIPTGLPRIDTFLDNERTKTVVAAFFSEHPHLVGKRIVLFAPTFRGRGIKDAYYDFDRLDFAQLYEACGDDTAVLFRMHHFVPTQVPIAEAHADRFFDFSRFGNTNDLLQVSDILVTDYSSIIYEFSLLDRPMLFFAYDKESYSATRGFHRDYDLTAPGKVCASTEELVKALQDKDFEMEKIEAYRRENFDVVDANAGDRVIDWLILDDPHTSELATSEAVQRTKIKDSSPDLEDISDQDEA
jgi:CDP-ribitol ribitolphosphotransferase / teichoic acid ribitol-phosphate polymerase